MSQNDKPTGPPTFQDSQKRTWTINLTLGLIDAVQAESGVDLIADEGDVSPMVALLSDRRKLAAALWACVAPQAATKQVTREAFINALDGDTLAAGWGAMVDAIVFFTPSSRRSWVQAAFDAQIAAMEQGAIAVAEVAASEETNEAIRDAILKIKSDLQAELPRALAESVSS